VDFTARTVRILNTVVMGGLYGGGGGSQDVSRGAASSPRTPPRWRPLLSFRAVQTEEWPSLGVDAGVRSVHVGWHDAGVVRTCEATVVDHRHGPARAGGDGRLELVGRHAGRIAMWSLTTTGLVHVAPASVDWASLSRRWTATQATG
jgi:hypothetical protein